MKLSEKSLELNVGTELLNLLRGPWGMPKAYLRGLTQREEKQEGVDFFAQLTPQTRLFAFQFKAPKGTTELPPYRYTLVREQHASLYQLAQLSPRSVFYVLPFYITPLKLQQDVPQLIRDTWLLGIDQMRTTDIFGSSGKTRIVRCRRGSASINPEYQLRKLSDVETLPSDGISLSEFASWYKRFRSIDRPPKAEGRRNPWLVRGLRLVIFTP